MTVVTPARDRRVYANCKPMLVTDGDGAVLSIGCIRLPRFVCAPTCDGVVGTHSTGMPRASRDEFELPIGFIGLTVRVVAQQTPCPSDPHGYPIPPPLHETLPQTGK